MLEVHVHNEISPNEDRAPSPTELTYVPPPRQSSPGFSGPLFSWREHYHPIFKRIVPLVAHRTARHGRLLAWLTRLTLWAALLGALTTVGCDCFRH